MLLYFKIFFMKINKFWLILAWSIAVTWINKVQAQTQTNVNKTQQEICENFSPKKTNTLIIRDKEHLPEEITNHEYFIKTNIYELTDIYWKQAALELIKQHMLIEINKFRKQNWKPEVKIDSDLQELSQDEAKRLFNIESCEHWKWNESLEHRLKDAEIEHISRWENLLQWYYTIKDAMNAWEKSPEHKELFLKENITHCWIGLEWDNIQNKEETRERVFKWNKAYYVQKQPKKATWCVTLIEK